MRNGKIDSLVTGPRTPAGSAGGTRTGPCMNCATTGATTTTGCQHIVPANAPHGLGTFDALFLAGLEVIRIALDIL